MRDYISAYKSRTVFMELDIVHDEPRMKGKLRVMMAELQLKSNWTNLKTIPRDKFISAKRDKNSHVKEN